MPEYSLDFESLKDKLTVAIDDIQDPGNFGAILRICDWFGIENVVCSNNSVDIYNPKVIQASMGAFLRVNVFYEDLDSFIEKYKSATSNLCYGTFLEGENIYTSELKTSGLIVFGNEGQGISESVEAQIENKLFIPPFSKITNHAESLNIASAASIICSEFRRRSLKSCE
jgi:TrmH family RNA methyltransferase